MRVAFGTTVLRRGLAHGTLDGIGNYSRELMRRLARTPGLALEPFAFAGDGAGARALDAGPFGPQAAFSAATGLPFPLAGRRIPSGTALVHAPDHHIPSLRGIPVVATLMDAIPLAHPEWVGRSWFGLKYAMWRRSAGWASHVITISEHAKQELVQWFGLRPERVSVTPLGVDARWFAAPSADELVRVTARHGLPPQFFVFVGTLQPRKNVARVIAAHRGLPRALRREYPLVVVGRAGWGCEADVAELSRGEDAGLRWLRYVPDEDLVAIVARAVALVFPSLHEGFGLPVLEAFAAGVPVVASNTTSLPEVAGDAALLVDPTDAGAIGDAMHDLVRNPALGEQLRLRGRERARTFTWERTAAATAEAYRRVLASS